MSILKKIFYVLLNTFVFLLVAESGAAFYFRNHARPEVVYQYSYLTGYKYDPYLGFASPVFPFYGNPNSKAALVITGGSTAAGIGVPDPQFTYYRVLEKNLIAKNLISPDQVVNFAVPGYVSHQESATYKFHVFNMAVAPKILVSFTGFNDLYFYLFRTLPIGDHEFGFAIDHVFRKGYPPAAEYSERVKNFIRSTNLFGIFHLMSHRKMEVTGMEPIRLSSDFEIPYQPEEPEPSAERIEQVAKNFLDNTLATALLAKSKGTKFVVLLQPNYYYGGELKINDNEWFHTVADLNNWINSVKSHSVSYDRFYNLVLKGLKDYKKQGLLEYLDYRALLKNAGPVFLDPVHFNRDGSRVVAEQMEADLKQFLQ